MASNTGKKPKDRHGRHAAGCKVYKLTNRRERNKIRRLKKHLAHFGADRIAQTALDRCKLIVGMR